MSISKANLKAEILEIIEIIGVYKDDCCVFDLNCLLKKWNAKHRGHFKQYGHGKIGDFLRSEIGVQESDGKLCIKVINSDTSHETEKGACAKSFSYSGCHTDSTSSATASPRNTSVRPKREEELQGLKLEVLKSIQDYLESDTKRTKGHPYLTLNELNSAWAQRHPSEKFRQKGFGSFKSFLVDKLNFEPSDQQPHQYFKITLCDIKKVLGNLEGRESNNSITTAQTDSSINNQYGGKPGGDKPKQNVVLPATAKDTMGNVNNAYKEQLSSDIPSPSRTPSQPKVSTKAASKRTIGDEHARSRNFSDEECNFIRLVTVLYKCGLESLRELFLRIHPSWKNEPGDIKRIVNGKFRPDSYEQSKFNSGDINEWDITLICKVLLYSKASKQRLEKDKEFRGYEDAIKSIRDIKNTMLSHNRSNSISKTEYEKAINTLQGSVIKLGFSRQIFEDTLEGADLSNNNLYYQMFVDELKRLGEEQRKSHNEILANQGLMTGIKEEVSDIKHDVSKILNKVESSTLSQNEVKQKLKSKPEWEEWSKVKRKLRHFDVENNQYILIVDRFEEVNSEHVKALANVSWKLVIDLDPNSDIDGFLSKFNPSDTKGGVVVTFPPSKLKGAYVDNMIDAKRMQWLFANGRNRQAQYESDDQNDNEDRQKDNLRSWRMSFKVPVQEFIRIYFQKLDRMKPMHCIVFGIRSGLSIQIAQDLVDDISGILKYRDFSHNYLSFAPELELAGVPNAALTNMSQNLFLEGLTSLLGISEEKYTLPSGQKGVETKLTQRQYNFLSEYLEILYNGCEDIPATLTYEEKDAFEIEHLKKFLCGKAISFPSLHYRHDAARCLTKKVYDRMTEMLQHIEKPRIVQITHAPGSGGTTIARRVLWDLHDTHPCAIVKLDHAPENIGSDSENENYVNNLTERILELEDRCEKMPAVLIDGNSRQVRMLSDCIVRKLEGRALILRCANFEKTADKNEHQFRSHQADKSYFNSEDELNDQNDIYFNTEDEFKVNPRLKDDDNDFRGFKVKYDHYCQIFSRNNKVGALSKNGRERVFHFPMMAMLDEFENLGTIVNDSLDIIKNDEVLEYEAAIIIAFVQLYSNFPTPGSLVAKLFKKNLKTYREVTKCCSETLINLMVPESAPSKEKFIASSADDYYSDKDGKYYDEDDDDDDDSRSSKAAVSKSSHLTTGLVLQSYSFQHHEVARLVLKHSGRSVDQVTEDFIQHRVLEHYKSHDENRPLLDNLFLYNKGITTASFSMLVVQLAKNDNGGRIFEEAAVQTEDVTFFSHVARFFAYKRSDFTKAKDLIKEGFKVDSNASVEKKRGVYSTEGHIVLMEMKHKNTDITDIGCLKKLSQEALDLFRKARDNPPWTFPNPLLGEVMVWQFCFEWIIKSNNGDVEEAVKFMLEDSFFSAAISDCIYLLDQVDRIVETVPTLNDPEHTKLLANEKRLNLVKALGRMRSKTKGGGWKDVDIHNICIASKFRKKAPEQDVLRLEVLWMLNETGRKIHFLSRAKKATLYAWLERLVNEFKMFVHTRDLMEAAAEQIEPPFEIDRALNIVARWQKCFPNDPFSYLYQCMLCFLKVYKGSVHEYRAIYESALESCKKKSQGSPRRHWWQYFIEKDGNGDSICALITRSTLEARFKKQDKTPREDRDVRRRDILDQIFWENHCRDFLLECTGRIECRQGSFRGKNIPYIMMEPGNVKVNVALNSIGTAYMDYQPDSRVSFVVCFTLNGPIAKGIRFIDSEENKRMMQDKLSKQEIKSRKENRKKLKKDS